MTFVYQVAPAGPGTTAGPATPVTLANPHGPGAVITIVGSGPDATAHIVGPHDDPADFWGIIVVLAVIGLSIAAARWLSGRFGPRPGRAGGGQGSGR